MGKTVVYIDGRRDVHSARDLIEKNRFGGIGTMTVGELISELQNYDEDAPIMLNNDNGYTYGKITRSSFFEDEIEVDEDDDEEEDDEDDDEE